MHALALSHLFPYEQSLGLMVLPAQRIQVSATRFRVPDICVVRKDSAEQILTQPPSIVVEILSPADSMSAMIERIEDYLVFGVANLWILDPQREKAFWADWAGAHEARNGRLEAIGTPVSIDLRDLFTPVASRSLND